MLSNRQKCFLLAGEHTHTGPAGWTLDRALGWLVGAPTAYSALCPYPSGGQQHEQPKRVPPTLDKLSLQHAPATCQPRRRCPSNLYFAKIRRERLRSRASKSPRSLRLFQTFDQSKLQSGDFVERRRVKHGSTGDDDPDSAREGTHGTHFEAGI